jgi:hypothetical protein
MFTQLSVGRRAMLALGVFGVYSAVVSFLLFYTGRAGQPTNDVFVVSHGLFVPVLFGAFYAALNDNSPLVWLTGLTPLVSAVLFFFLMSLLTWSPLPPLTELFAWLGALVAFMLAVSGSWALLGYTAGTAARWSHQESISKRRLLDSCRWVVLSSAIILPTYLGAIVVWVFDYGDVVY